MAKGTASDALVRQAKREIRACQDYLARHFANPTTEEVRDAKALAEQRIRPLAVATRDRDAARITAASKNLSKVMIYLWALRQFRAKGD